MKSLARMLKRAMPYAIYKRLHSAAWIIVCFIARARYWTARGLGSLWNRQLRRKKYYNNANRAGHQRAELAQQYARELPLLDEYVMYESYNGRDFAGNPYALFKYLLDHPDYQHLTHVISVNEASNPKARAFKDHPRVTIVETHSEEFIRYQQTAKYQINDASFKDYNIKRDGQVYVHGWHSTLLKKLACDTGRPWEAVRVNRALLQTDFFISPNRLTTDIMFSSHGVKPFYRGEIAEFGYPRNDLTINANKDDVRERLGIPNGQKVALYAPTWRGNYRPENTVEQTLAYWKQLQSALPSSYVLVVKFHTMVYSFMTEEDRAACVPEDLDINEVLGATDLLITDYSGIFYDFLCTGNPIVYFMPDKEEYLAQKDGLYLDIETLPGPICMNSGAVGSAVRDLARIQAMYASRYREFVERFVGDDDGRACERTADLVFKGRRDSRVYRFENTDKQNIVIYPGNLALNGVTTSFLALLENIDYDRFNVAVLLPDDRRYRETQAKINRRASIFYLHTEWGLNRRETRLMEDLAAFGMSSIKHVPCDAVRAVVRRTFGDLHFDCAINFNGYFPQAAALMRFGVSANRYVIYLHNDLNEDRKIKHPQLHSIFSMYRFYDDKVCVSRKSRDANNKKIGRYVRFKFGRKLGRRMRFAMNSIVVPDIVERSRHVPAQIAYNGRKLSLFERDPLCVSGFEWPTNENVNFIAIGRISKEKNHARLLTAFSKVVAENANVRLYLVGDGILAHEVRAQIDRLSLHDKVVMTGPLSNPLGLMKACDCFVSSSDIEGQPITILEALVLKKPIIATKINGHLDMLKPYKNCLVPRSVKGLSESMARFVADPTSYQTAFDAGEYSERAMAQFYRTVLGVAPQNVYDVEEAQTALAAE